EQRSCPSTSTPAQSTLPPTLHVRPTARPSSRFSTKMPHRTSPSPSLRLKSSRFSPGQHWINPRLISVQSTQKSNSQLHPSLSSRTPQLWFSFDNSLLQTSFIYSLLVCCNLIPDAFCFPIAAKT